MRISSLFALLFALPSCLSIAKQTADLDQKLLASEPKVIFRDAVVEDIEDIVTIILDAFAPGDAARYTNPGYEQYKDYTHFCACEKIKRLWKDWNPKIAFAKVITVEEDENTAPLSSKSNKPVAFAMWTLHGEGDEQLSSDHFLTAFWNSFPSELPRDASLALPRGDRPPYNCSLQLGVNKTRSADFGRQLNQVHYDYIETRFDEYVYLQVLATHPSWDGHNFGAMNLHWGMEFAKDRNIPITLIATPAGYPLYHSLGFKSLKNATITKLDGEGIIWYEVMKFENA